MCSRPRRSTCPARAGIRPSPSSSLAPCPRSSTRSNKNLWNAMNDSDRKRWIRALITRLQHHHRRTRKLATDARMLLRLRRMIFTESKVNALWWRTVRQSGCGAKGKRRHADDTFCDMGVHPTPWGYSAYDDVLDKLVARGIPRGQIAAIGEADSDAKKQALFEKIRQGTVRVLMGSTQKMGTGTNVQKRLRWRLTASVRPWRASGGRATRRPYSSPGK